MGWPVGGGRAAVAEGDGMAGAAHDGAAVCDTRSAPASRCVVPAGARPAMCAVADSASVLTLSLGHVQAASQTAADALFSTQGLVTLGGSALAVAGGVLPPVLSPSPARSAAAAAGRTSRSPRRIPAAPRAGNGTHESGGRGGVLRWHAAARHAAARRVTPAAHLCSCAHARTHTRDCTARSTARPHMLRSGHAPVPGRARMCAREHGCMKRCHERQRGRA